MVTVATLVAKLQLDMTDFKSKTDELAKSAGTLSESLKGIGDAAKPASEETGKFSSGPLKDLIESFKRGSEGGLSLGSVFTAMANPITLAGLAVGGLVLALHSAVNSVAETAREVQTLMATSGLSARAADNLSDTFKILGLNSDLVSNAMFRMATEVEQGGAGLGRLGIAVHDAAGNLKVEGDLFLEVRDKISALGSAAERDAAMISVFQRNARGLAPAFALNREEFVKWMEQAERLHPWSEKAQAEGLALVRAQESLALAFGGLWNTIGEGLVGSGVAWRNWLAESLTGIAQFAAALPGLLPGIGPLITLFQAAKEVRAMFGPASSTFVGASGSQQSEGFDAATAATRRGTADIQAAEAVNRQINADLLGASAVRIAQIHLESAQHQEDRQANIELEREQITAQSVLWIEYYARQRGFVKEQYGDIKDNAALKKALAETEIAEQSTLTGLRVRDLALQTEEVHVGQARTSAFQIGLKLLIDSIPQYDVVQQKVQALTEHFRELGIKAGPDFKAALESFLVSIIKNITEADAFAKRLEVITFDLDQGEKSAQAYNKIQMQLGATYAALNANGVKYAETLALIDAQTKSAGQTGIVFDGVAARISAAKTRLDELLKDQIEWNKELAFQIDNPDQNYYLLLKSWLADDATQITDLTDKLSKLQTIQQITTLSTSVFQGVRGAFDTMTTGILQGTQTFGQAMTKLWTNIGIAIGNAFIKTAFDTVEKAMTKLLQDTIDTLQGAKGGENGLLGALAKIGVSLFGATGGNAPAGGGTALGGMGGGNAPMGMAVGGIVMNPTRAIVGESGPEAVIPLSQLASMGMGGGGVEIRIIDQRAKGGDIETKESKTDNNRRLIEVLITDTVKGAFSGGQMDRLMSDTYGLSRHGAGR